MGKTQACEACWRNKLSCSLVPSRSRCQKRKARDELEEGPQPKRLKVVVEEGGSSGWMRSETTAHNILLEQSEMLGEVQDLLVKHLKEAKEIWRGQEDLQRQVAGLRFAMDDIVDLIGGSRAEVEAEIGGKGGEAEVGGNGGEAEKGI